MDYETAVRISRGETLKDEIIKNRTNMTPEDYDKLMATPVEEVADYTKNVELKDYSDELKENGLSEVIDKINEDLPIEEVVPKPKKRRTKKRVMDDD